MAHGDGLGDDSVLSDSFGKYSIANFYVLVSRPSILAGQSLAHAWSNSSRESGGMVPFWGKRRSILVQFAKKLREEPDIHYFIFGHRHVLLDLPIQEYSRVIMLGD